LVISGAEATAAAAAVVVAVVVAAAVVVVATAVSLASGFQWGRSISGGY